MEIKSLSDIRNFIYFECLSNDESDRFSLAFVVIADMSLDVWCREEKRRRKGAAQWQRENNILTDNEKTSEHTENIKYRLWGHAWTANSVSNYVSIVQYKTSITRSCFTDYARGCVICVWVLFSSTNDRKETWKAHLLCCLLFRGERCVCSASLRRVRRDGKHSRRNWGFSYIRTCMLSRESFLLFTSILRHSSVTAMEIISLRLINNIHLDLYAAIALEIHSSITRWSITGNFYSRS